MAIPDNERARAFTERQKEKGLARVTVWVPAGHVEHLKRLVLKWRMQCGIK
jgi:hypothetical protein